MYCGLVTLYVDIYLEQQVARIMTCYLTVPSHYLNPWLFIINRSNDNNLHVVSQELPQSLIDKINLKFIDVKLIPFKSPRSQWGYLNPSSTKLICLPCCFQCIHIRMSFKNWFQISSSTGKINTSHSPSCLLSSLYLYSIVWITALQRSTPPVDF